MSLTQESISSFQNVYKNVYGVLLSVDEAESKALEIMNFMKLIYRSMPNIHPNSNTVYKILKQ